MTELPLRSRPPHLLSQERLSSRFHNPSRTTDGLSSVSIIHRLMCAFKTCTTSSATTSASSAGYYPRLGMTFVRTTCTPRIGIIDELKVDIYLGIPISGSTGFDVIFWTLISLRVKIIDSLFQVWQLGVNFNQSYDMSRSMRTTHMQILIKHF